MRILVRMPRRKMRAQENFEESRSGIEGRGFLSRADRSRMDAGFGSEFVRERKRWRSGMRPLVFNAWAKYDNGKRDAAAVAKLMRRK